MASYGRQHENIEQIATALFEMRQAFAVDAHRTGTARSWNFASIIVRPAMPATASLLVHNEIELIGLVFDQLAKDTV